MAALRATAYHVWSTTEILGKGATSNVYLGREKKTGKKCAVKVFTTQSMLNPELRKRETDVLRKLKHPNIVELYAIEQESTTRFDVVIMEYCPGGSLLDVLNMPENVFGLQEPELLKFLSDLAGGMEYMKIRQITHRDIKPGNIMRTTASDGSYVYKLADFGTARELRDNEAFMSLVGTEEYLHPDMYARAFINESQKRHFDNKVDLWSIGVTLYHAATGELPFQPYRGREAKNVMYRLTTKKASGVITGTEDEHGNVAWGSTLPETCELSTGMQELLTPMIAGLEECDVDKMWNFDQFFGAVKKICSMVIVHVFDVVNWQQLKCYQSKSAKVNELKTTLTRQSAIDLTDAILMRSGELLNKRGDTIIDTLPPTSSTDPIFVWGPQDSDPPAVMTIPGYLQWRAMPRYHSLQVDHDASICISGVCCSVARRLVDHANNVDLANKAATMLESIIKAQTKEQKDSLGNLQQLQECTAKRLQTVENCHQLCTNHIKASCSTPSSLPEETTNKLKTLQASMDGIKDAKTKLASVEVGQAAGSQVKAPLWNSNWVRTCQRENNWSGEAGTVKDEIMEVYTGFKAKFMSTRGRKQLNRNDMQIHEFERLSLNTLSRTMQETLKGCLDNGVGPLVARARHFYSSVLKARVQLQKQDQLAETHRAQLDALDKQLDEVWVECMATLTEALGELRDRTESDYAFVKSPAEGIEAQNKTQELARTMITRLSSVLMEMSAMREQVDQSNNVMRTRMEAGTYASMPGVRSHGRTPAQFDSLMSLPAHVYMQREKDREKANIPN